MGLRSLKHYLFVFLLTAVTLCAQQDRGTFTGTVTDPTGSVVPAVKVTVVNTATNAQYDSLTGELGTFRVPNLPVGTYKITFEAAGFKATVRDGLTLNVGQVARIDTQLQIGSATESIEVTAQVPLLQTETPEVGTVLNNRVVTDLPLGFAGGRYAENFAYKLTPGVSGNNWESRINGSPAFSKAVVLDGADATIYISGQFGESSPSMEALEEFKVQTSGMSAEYGRTGGGVFNFVMKSGTNQLHGSAMGQIHNEWMDANSWMNNYFDKPKQRDRRHNYGGSLGGPVYIPGLYNGRDKTFFYVAYERYKESYAGGGSPSVSVPLDEMWGGNLSKLLTNQVIGQDALGRDILRGAIYDPSTTRIVNGQMVRDVFPGNIIPANRISGPSQKLGEIFKQHYSPDLPGLLTNNAFFPVSNQAGFTQNQFSTKVDHYLSAAHKINGSFVYVDRPRYLVDQGGVWDFGADQGGPLSRSRLQHVRSWYGRAAYDWTVSPTVLNHLQLGFNRQRNPSMSSHLGENGSAALGLQGFSRDYNYPEITGLSGNGINYPTLGYQANDFGAGQNFQIINTMSWFKGRHNLRMGVDWRRSYLRWRTDSGPAQINFGAGQTGLQGFGQTGHGFASMLLGEVGSANVPMNTPTGSRYTNFALFFQDDFKVASRLTLNLGVRWDYQPLPVEHYNRYASFNPNLIDPVWGLPGALEFANDDQRHFGDSSHKDFSPRVGFAYQANDKTAIRGGYGIFYLARNGNGWSGVPWGQTAGFGYENKVTSPIGYQSAYNWSNAYPGTVRALPQNASLAGGNPGVWGIVSWDPDAGKNGYVQQWNFNIQRELPYEIVFDIGYVGSKGTAIQANELRRLNQLDPKYLVLGNALNAGVTKQSELPASIVAAGGKYPFGNAGIWMNAYQALLPFPHVMSWNTIQSAFTPLGFSTYHAMQVQLNKRFSHGMNFTSNYTFSKSIDNVRSAFGDTWGGNSGRPMDYYNLKTAKSVSDADRTHAIKIGAQYDLPFGRGRRFGNDVNRAVDIVLGGWTIQYIGNYNSGWAMGIGGAGTAAGNFATNTAIGVNPNGEPLMTGVTGTPYQQQYINTALFINPIGANRFTRGNLSYRLSQLRGPWELSEDFGLQKNFRPTESMRVQLRADILNGFNRTLWGNIETDSASPNFGKVTGASDWFSPRKIQVGIRADW
ncbi:MAG TPA: TonB-dependent receptor [Bryobacteraceae bacterium]|nr:TonB-dependent receptor [Bryobacteraceae bacterium]